MGSIENVNVFLDTEKQCKKISKLKDSLKNSVKNQKLITEDMELQVPELNKYASRAKIVVSHKRTFEAASAYTGKKVAVLNFASASNPGGGVVRGAGAQEECLCRCSTLYFALNVKEMWDGFYNPHRMAHDSIHNDDIIFTPEITVFKTDTGNPRLMSEKDWYNVDVITCAAPNLRSNPTNKYNPGDGDKVTVSDEELGTIHEKRLRRILDVAVSEGCEVIVLGAFGCGAFKNNPKVVAEAARKVLPDYLYAFDTIEYAIYSRQGSENYDVFNGVLSRMK